MPRTRSIAWSELKLGIVGIIAVVLTMVSIVAVGGASGFWWERYNLKTRFDDIQGLKTGAVVRVSGKEVGTVKAIEFAGAQVEVALGTGGLTGHGLFSGAESHLDSVSARSSDFMFGFVGSELGLAGGLLLLVIAPELLHPAAGGAASLASGDANIALVPLGTPLLAGPGAIAATMLYSRQADDLGGTLSVVLAIAAVLTVIYLAMRYAALFSRVLRDNGIELLSKVMGLLVAAIAVQLVARAVEAWVTNGVA